MPEEASMTSHYVDSSAGRLHYQVAGKGKPVVLIHGGGPGAYGYSNFRRNIGPLALSNRVIVIDLPGFGQSASRPAPGSIFAAMADGLREVLDHAEVEKASLVGNSLGGGTSLRFTLDNPDRVDKLVLMGTGGSLPITSTFPTEGLLRMLHFYDGEGPSMEKLRRVVDLLVFDPASITDELLEERLRTATLPQTMANPPLKGRGHNPLDDLWREPLYQLHHRTLVIWGREDRVVPLDAAFILLKTIPNADLHVFSKCGHWAQWEKADEFNELVGNFLALD